MRLSLAFLLALTALGLVATMSVSPTAHAQAAERQYVIVVSGMT